MLGSCCEEQEAREAEARSKHRAAVKASEARLLKGDLLRQHAFNTLHDPETCGCLCGECEEDGDGAEEASVGTQGTAAAPQSSDSDDEDDDEMEAAIVRKMRAARLAQLQGAAAAQVTKTLKLLRLLRLAKLFRLMRVSKVVKYIRILKMWFEEKTKIIISDMFVRLTRYGSWPWCGCAEIEMAWHGKRWETGGVRCGVRFYSYGD